MSLLSTRKTYTSSLPMLWHSSFVDDMESLFDENFPLYTDESTKEKYIEIDLPGVKKEDLKVSVDDNRKVYLAAERKGNRPMKYERTIMLPKYLDTGSCRVILKAGVLTMYFKPKEKIQPERKEIEIQEEE